MIDDKTKSKLLKEISKLGIVYLACLKIGVDKSTYYRWKEDNKKFRKLANEAEDIGDSNFCDIAESMLSNNVKKGDQRAIEFVLTHRSKKYRPKKEINKVVILHKKDYPLPIPQKTLEDLLNENEEDVHQRALRLHKKFTSGGLEIPNKPDGKPIELHELADYEAYIENWQKTQSNSNAK